MQTRVSFNSGELSPEMSARCDLDQFARGCDKLENWHLSQMGGIKRRHGMRHLTSALDAKSRLIPYIYSYADADDLRFIVELAKDSVRVLSYEGEELALFTADEDELDFYYDEPRSCYYKQINKLLIITSLDNHPMVLKRDDDGTWELEKWKFKHHPWRYNHELRDESISISRDSSGVYSVDLTNITDASETLDDLTEADYLRASFWIEQQETTAKAADILQGVEIVQQVPPTATKGKKYAVHTDSTIKYFVCKQAWNSSSYITGLDSPANYSDSFMEAENLDGFDSVTAYYTIKEAVDASGGGFVKGEKLAIKAGYWEYYTCIKDNFANAYDSNFTKFTDYPGYFIQGVPVGDALPCKGAWSFFCSGLWYGCYEVRRNYESNDIDRLDWESRGISFSRNDEPSNISITGTEEEEECYMRLFLTKSKHMSATDLRAGFPADSCGNALVIEGYKHDTVLKATPVGNEVAWSCIDKIETEWTASRDVQDWSWAAFSERYGYPLLCEVHSKRLVFASTEAEPQTLWFSRSDDLDNFLTGAADNAAMNLTIQSMSQNPICWLQSQRDRLLIGTSDTEYAVTAGASAGGVLSSSTAYLQENSRVGSDGVAALSVEDKAIFVERGAGRVREHGYSFEVDGWVARDISVFAPHICSDHGGIVELSFIRKPDTVLLCVLSDGQLGLCTYNSFHQVKAWHRWVTDGKVLSVCGMPNGKEHDRIYLVTEREDRTDSGAITQVRYNIEVVEPNNDYKDDGERDYDSTFITNALTNILQQRVHKETSEHFYFLLGHDLPITNTNVVITDDAGITWRKPQSYDEKMHKGWGEYSASSGYKWERKVGMKVTGDYACHILAIQG